MYLKGWGVEQNPDEAVIWYRLAADNGWPNALDGLGNLYKSGPDDNGRGAPEDINEAIRLYQVASELGSTNAMNNLGTLYLSDTLGEPNVELGVQWLSRAADRGNRFAPFNLGRMYRDGRVLERNYDKALEYFQLSADFGFSPAYGPWAECIRTATGWRRTCRKLRSITSSGAHGPIQSRTHSSRMPTPGSTASTSPRSSSPKRKAVPTTGSRRTESSLAGPTRTGRDLRPAATIWLGRHSLASKIS